MPARRTLLIATRAALSTSLFLATLLACGGQEEVMAPPPPHVTVKTLVEREVPEMAEFAARLEAVNTVEIRARVEGELLERGFVEGSRVHRGQMLLRIDPAEYGAGVVRLEAEVARAKAALVNDRLEFERAKELRGSNVMSQSSYDKAMAEQHASEAAVKASEAALEQAELNLDYTRIYAPLSGVIGRIHVDVGNLVGPSTGVLATITELDPIYSVFSVSERVILERTNRQRELARRGEAAAPLEASLRLSDDSIYERTGSIDYIDPEVDPTTGTLQVRATFSNPDHVLRPGSYVTVILRSTEKLRRIVLPQSAVSESQLGTTVLVVNGEDRVSVRKVEVGARIGSEWVVEKGLEAGERVIVRGLQKARPGAPVTPVEAEDDAGSPTAGS